MKGSIVAGLYDLNRDGTETPAEALVFDRNGYGWLSDEERDEDADGLTNYDEFSGRVNPFNPCLPFADSRTCNGYPSFDGGWARRSTTRRTGSRSTERAHARLGSVPG